MVDERPKKTPQKGHFMGAEWVPKTWKISNLTTTNAILIFFGRGWTQLKSVRGREEKTSQNEPENEFFGFIYFSDYTKSVNVCDALFCIASLVKYSHKLDFIWEKNP